MGEFDVNVQENLLNNGGIMEAAIQDILTRAKDRHKILVFCPKINGCWKFRDIYQSAVGDDIEVLDGNTDKDERARIIKEFREGSLRVLVNCQILTTGFDAPNVDCVVLLRATTSPGLYYQMVGRGLRKSEGKEDCLILDYGKNIERHGAINAMQVHKRKTGRNEKPATIVRECPQCGELIGIREKVCPVCKYEFPAPELNIETQASEKAVIDESETIDFTVVKAEYTEPRYGKEEHANDRYIQVIYTVKESLKKYSYFLGVEYGGYSQTKVKKWVEQHTDENVLQMFGGGVPDNCETFLYMADHFCFATPDKIRVKYDPNAKYKWEVKKLFVNHKPTLEEINEKIAKRNEAEAKRMESGYY
jgi:DNA repair protein RadD